jgi:hypothetical protein
MAVLLVLPYFGRTDTSPYGSTARARNRALASSFAQDPRTCVVISGSAPRDRGNAPFRFGGLFPRSMISDLRRALFGDFQEAQKAEWLELLRGETANHKIEHIVVSCSPFGLIPLVAQVAAEVGCSFSVDMRDCFYREGMSWQAVLRRREARFYSSSLKKAKAVIYVTPQELGRDRDRLGLRISGAVTSGFTKHPPTGEPVRPALLYTGTIMPAGNHLARLFGMLKDRSISLEYAGPHADEVLRQAQKAKFPNAQLNILGQLTSAECAAQASSALGLVLFSTGYHGIPGGKFYDYLGSGRPIVCVPFEDDFMRGVFDRHRVGKFAGTIQELNLFVDWARSYSQTYEEQKALELEFSWDAKVDQFRELLA